MDAFSASHRQLQWGFGSDSASSWTTVTHRNIAESLQGRRVSSLCELVDGTVLKQF